MKKIAVVLIFLLGLQLQLTSFAHAVTIGTSPPPATSPDVIVTMIVENTNNPVPDYLELYNQSGSAINLDGWSLTFDVNDASSCLGGLADVIDFPSGWILPQHYLTFDSTAAQDPSVSAVFNIDPSLLTCVDNPQLSLIRIDSSSSLDQLITIPDGTDAVLLQNGVKHRQRDNSPTSTRTLSGSFSNDYVSLSAGDASLYSDPLYVPPPDASGLRIIELLPHASSCSPLDTSLTCADYIKLYNSSHSAVDLSAYRLRTSYGGNKSTSSNAISLSSNLSPGEYALINTKNDGSPLNLTEGGGYVWLEDAYGSKIYKPVISYPDATSETKKGWAWALDGSVWRWTSSPQPNGPNIFPIADIATLSLSTSSGLKPCSTGQERNPATNRCRSIMSVSTTGKTPVPCPTGQERNPATNRCRKTASAVLGASTFNVADVAAPTIASGTQWALAGGSIALALGYAAFEWRQEIMLAFSDGQTKILSLLKNLRN